MVAAERSAQGAWRQDKERDSERQGREKQLSWSNAVTPQCLTLQNERACAQRGVKSDQQKGLWCFPKTLPSGTSLLMKRCLRHYHHHHTSRRSRSRSRSRSRRRRPCPRRRRRPPPRRRRRGRGRRRRRRSSSP